MAMNNLGDFALIIGDIHIPQRATDIPEQFKDLLVPNKMQYVISPGNIGSREVSAHTHTHTLWGSLTRIQRYLMKANIDLLMFVFLDCRMVGELGSGQESSSHC